MSSTTNTNGIKPKTASVVAKVPCAFFLSSKGCKQGDKCFYSHDTARIIEYYHLVPCQGKCGTYNKLPLCNQCHWLKKTFKCASEDCDHRIKFGTYCRECNEAWEAAELKRIEEAEPVACQGFNCKELIQEGRRFCKGCQDAQNRYVIKKLY
jgi:hypothetical protein